VAARLGAPSNFKDFKDALTTNPRLNVKVLRQDEFYAEQSRLLYGLITGLGILVAGLMAIGAVFGALNTMYAAVATRTREIATLRALGFGSSAVVVSVLVESIGLALLGGSLGGGLAYIAFDGFRAATLNWQSFSQVAFAFDVTPQLLILGIVCATAIGFVGGLLPAVRAARLPVARALREV
jgi:putative ABC transport system permease protein